MSESSSRRSQVGCFIGVSTTHATLVLEWRRSSQALILSLGPTPTRNDLTSFIFCRTKGRPSRERGKGGRNRPFTCRRFSSPRRSCAFLRPDWLALSAYRVSVDLRIFPTFSVFGEAFSALSGSIPFAKSFLLVRIRIGISVTSFGRQFRMSQLSASKLPILDCQMRGRCRPGS